MEEDAASSFSSSVTEASIQVELFVSFNDKIWWDIDVSFMTAENRKKSISISNIMFSF